MRKLIYTIALAVLAIISAQAQEVTAKLNEAESSYSSGDLENSRFALQQALNDINQAIGKDILALLPAKLNDMACNTKDDNVTGAAGVAGLNVNRTYGTEGKTAQIEIMSDSPLLTSLNTLLAMPMIMGNSDPNQKRVKVAGYKGMLQKETSDNKDSYNLQLPINNTLLTLKVTGYPNENDVINMANSLPIDQIAKLAQ